MSWERGYLGWGCCIYGRDSVNVFYMGICVGVWRGFDWVLLGWKVGGVDYVGLVWNLGGWLGGVLGEIGGLWLD